MRERRVDRPLLCHSRKGGNPDRRLLTRPTATHSSMRHAVWVPAFAGTTENVELSAVARDVRSAL